MYHDSIRQHETKLQAQYEAMHHGDDEDSSGDDGFVEGTSGVDLPDEAVTPSRAGETTATEGGSSLASVSSEAAPPFIASSGGPAPAGPAHPKRQLKISSMFGRSS